jgi:tetratricopeptide (TPR) repeat protein
MASDDKSTEQDKPTPKNLLEEIRRRAEEAELRRIEDDEKVAGAGEEAGVPPPPPSEAPPPAAPSAPVMSKAVREQKILVLRERLNVAISRGRLEKARSLLSDLGALVPGDPALAEFEKRIARAEPKAPAAEVSAPPPAEAPKPEKKVPRAPKKPGPVEKSVPELLEEAHAHYQQEKYQKARQCVQTVLALDPENEDALRLGEQIEKAEQIIELVKKEEARRKEAEAAEFGEVIATPIPAASADDKDPWGTEAKGALPAEPGFDLRPKKRVPLRPPSLR